MADLPQTQYAVQLVGPDELVLNKAKQVPKPGRHQILCRVEAVGLCFSDLKLLKQFSSHVRKSEVVSGIDLDILKEIPSYVPGQAATVPGHEAVVRIEAVGPGGCVVETNSGTVDARLSTQFMELDAALVEDFRHGRSEV